MIPHIDREKKVPKGKGVNRMIGKSRDVRPDAPMSSEVGRLRRSYGAERQKDCGI